VLLTQWYRDQSETRRRELLQALAINLGNLLIDQVHVLVDTPEDVIYSLSNFNWGFGGSPSCFSLRLGRIQSMADFPTPSKPGRCSG